MLAAVVASLTLFIFLYRLLKPSHTKPLPPGPKKLPLIGNLHQQPSTEQWVTYAEWHKKHGPLMSLRLAGFNVILIGSYQVAYDLMEKKGRIYSTRPRMIYLRECMTRGLQPGLMPYGEMWKKIHRLQAPFLSGNALTAYRKVHDLQTLELLQGLLNTDNPAKQFTRYNCNVTFTLAVGQSLPPGDDGELLQVASFIEKKLSHLHWGNFLVDVFPILNYLPESCASWKRSGNAMYNEEIKVMSRVIETALRNGNWSWATELMEQNKTEDMSWDQMCYFVGELLLGALISTTSMLNLFVTLSTIFPECMKKCQEELDAVVGDDRIPTIDDESRLPYLNGFISETLRWRPLAPLGMMHSVSEDDEYMGYHIPKDSVIVTNIYRINRDEAIYPEPEKFRPERWIENPNLPMAVFGFGRRKCPGSALARRSMFMALSRIFWTYNIKPVRSVNEKEELSKIKERGHSLPSLPPPSEAIFEVRSPKHREVVEAAWASVEKNESLLLEEIRGKVKTFGK